MTPKAENTDCDLHGEARILTSADKELLNKMYQCKQGCCGSLSVSGNANGIYRKTHQLHNNQPVFKHAQDKWCIFMADFGKLRACHWLHTGDNSQG